MAREGRVVGCFRFWAGSEAVEGGEIWLDENDEERRRAVTGNSERL